MQSIARLSMDDDDGQSQALNLAVAKNEFSF